MRRYKNRRVTGKSAGVGWTAGFLGTGFSYLKGDQSIKTLGRLLSVAV